MPQALRTAMSKAEGGCGLIRQVNAWNAPLTRPGIVLIRVAPRACNFARGR